MWLAMRWVCVAMQYALSKGGGVSAYANKQGGRAWEVQRMGADDSWPC